MEHSTQKEQFAVALKAFAGELEQYIVNNNEWTVRGFIDVFKNVYTVSSDTKIVSKILELHIFPLFTAFADKYGYNLELATYQNWYPDLTFISKTDPTIKFAVDLKTTYRTGRNSDYCNGFTLGSHGKYFTERDCAKNIQYPYREYSGHFCLGIIYTRAQSDKPDETRKYTVDEVPEMPAVIKNLIFFAEEKWKIASDKGGSGNTANIGSIKKISDILAGNGVFAKAGEEYFDDYWINFGNLMIPQADGEHKKLSSFAEYVSYRGLPKSLLNPAYKSTENR